MMTRIFASWGVFKKIRLGGRGRGGGADQVNECPCPYILSKFNLLLSFNDFCRIIFLSWESNE